MAKQIKIPKLKEKLTIDFYNREIVGICKARDFKKQIAQLEFLRREK